MLTYQHSTNYASERVRQGREGDSREERGGGERRERERGERDRQEKDEVRER